MKYLLPALLFSLILAYEVPYVENQLIAKFNKQITVEHLQEDLTTMDMEPEKLLVRRLNIWLVKVNPAQYGSTEAALSLLKKYPGTLYAQLDHKVTEREIPNDPRYEDQWDMNNTGQGGGTVDADIDAPEAWDIATGGTTALGDRIAVAVIDSGFDLDHQDLIDNIWVNEGEIPGNGIDDDGNGYIDDINGWDAYGDDNTIPSSTHGTHVSGTIGATGDNGIDVTGINWDVDIICVAGSSSSTSIISIAYGYVLDNKTLWIESDGEFGANVVATNSSFGVDYADCASGDYPLWNDLYDAMGAVGILSAAATINSNQNVDIIGDVPTGCSSDYIIAVTNTNKWDLKYPSAGYGLTTIDLGAPGTSICSTTPNDNVSCSQTGTSMASPHVAGTVGLLHSAAPASWAELYLSSPGPTALELKTIILSTVDPLASLEGLTVSGGRLNLYNAVAEISNPSNDYQLGDINQDGLYNVLDILLIVNFIIMADTPSPGEAWAADLNADGIINITDIILLINIITGA